MEILNTVSFDSTLSILSFVGVMLTLFVTGCWSFFIDQLIDGDNWTLMSSDIPVKEQRVQIMRSLIEEKWLIELNSAVIETNGYEIVDFKSYIEVGFSLPSPEEMEMEHDMQDDLLLDDRLMTLVDLSEVAGPEFEISVKACSDTWVYDYRNFFTECAIAESWGVEYDKAMDEAVVEM